MTFPHDLIAIVYYYNVTYCIQMVTITFRWLNTPRWHPGRWPHTFYTLPRCSHYAYPVAVTRLHLPDGVVPWSTEGTEPAGVAYAGWYLVMGMLPAPTQHPQHRRQRIGSHTVDLLPLA